MGIFKRDNLIASIKFATVEERVAACENNIALSDDDYYDVCLLFNAQRYRNSINKCYYVIYHLCHAAINLEGLSFNDHDTVIQFFNLIYVKENFVDKSVYKSIMQLKGARRDKEYKHDMKIPITYEEADENRKIMDYLRNEVKELIENAVLSLKSGKINNTY